MRTHIDPCCQFYYCNKIWFENGSFSFEWKMNTFRGYNGTWEGLGTSARLVGKLYKPNELRDVIVQVEVLRDRSRGYFTTHPASRLPSEKFSMLLVERRTQRVQSYIGRVAHLSDKTLQVSLSKEHSIIIMRQRRFRGSNAEPAWGPHIFQGIAGSKEVTLYV